MRSYLLILVTLLTLSGCSAALTVLPPPDPLTPAAVVATRLPVSTQRIENEPAAATAQPSPTPICTNSLWFLSDLTIPDGSEVSPGVRLDKRWEVRNNGTCNWNENYQIKLIAGPGMGLPAQQALYPALSDTDVVIRMVFIAPQEPGQYRSAWQAFDPFDHPFGDPFFIDIVIPEVGDTGE